MIKKIDHFVITTAHLEDCLDFYQKLGFEVRSAGDNHQLFAGDFKINIHLLGKERSPHAQTIQTGSSDFCFEITGSLATFRTLLLSHGLTPTVDTVMRNGVRGTMQSIYFYDPDGNLVECASYMP